MISGYIEEENIKSLFEYENKILKITYENHEKCENLLKCKKFPLYNDVYFYQNEKYLLKKGIYEYCPDMVIEFKEQCSNISAISFKLDEIDEFYNISLSTANLDSFTYNGEISIQTKPFDQTDSPKYNIKVKGKEMLLQIIVGKSFSYNSRNPLVFNKQIRIEYDFQNNYSLIYETIKELQRFVSFISYRRNIIFKEILLYTKNEEKLSRIGIIEYIDKNYIERKTSIKYIKEHSYFYENINDYIGDLFNKISSNEYALLNIPKDDYMINIYKEERILMITSTFEDLFSLIYCDKITHKEKSIKMREYFYDFLTKNEKQLKFENQNYREFWNNLKKYVSFDNFSSKLNEVLKKDEYINCIIKKFYEKQNIEYQRSKVTERVEKIRNKCAHGEYRKIAEDRDLYCIKALEIIVYYLQLKYVGISTNNINIILYRVFGVSLPSKNLENINLQ